MENLERRHIYDRDSKFGPSFRFEKYPNLPIGKFNLELTKTPAKPLTTY